MATTVWRGHLMFGLVSFPVRLYRAARAEKVSFKRLYRPAPPQAPAPSQASRSAASSTPPSPNAETGQAKTSPAEMVDRPILAAAQHAPITSSPVPEPEVFRTHNTVTAAGEAGEPVSSDQLVKGYEYDKGQYVVLEDEELQSITPQTSKEMQIVEFVHLDEIDPIYFETSYYLAPDEAGERPYTLLQEALRQSGYVGVAQLAMHRREHVIIIRPGRSGMIAHTMFYPDEVRRIEEYRPHPADMNPRELDLAKRLIETMVVPFEPEKFRDNYRERVKEMIAGKVAGKRVAHEPVTLRKTAQVIDIMQALQQSLQMAKKPPVRSDAQPSPNASEAEPAPSRAPRRRKSASG